MHRWPGFFIVVLALLVPTPGYAGNCPSETLLMAWSPWDPYQYQNEEGRLTGLDIELVEAVFDHMSCPVRYEEMPWKRQLLHLKSGSVDLITGASFVEERTAYGHFSEPYREEQVVLFVNEEAAGHYPVSELSDLLQMDFTLGIALGYFYGDTFERLLKNPAFAARVVELPSEEHAFRMLALGRVDGVLADPFVAAHLVRQHQWQGVFRPMATVYQAPIHFLFSRQSVPGEWVSRFNRSLRTLQETGETDAIVKRYLD